MPQDPMDMVIGLDEFRDPKHLRLHWVLINPFLAVDRQASCSPDQQARSAPTFESDAAKSR